MNQPGQCLPHRRKVGDLLFDHRQLARGQRPRFAAGALQDAVAPRARRLLRVLLLRLGEVSAGSTAVRMLRIRFQLKCNASAVLHRCPTTCRRSALETHCNGPAAAAMVQHGKVVSVAGGFPRISSRVNDMQFLPKAPASASGGRARPETNLNYAGHMRNRRRDRLCTSIFHASPAIRSG